MLSNSLWAVDLYASILFLAISFHLTNITTRVDSRSYSHHGVILPSTHCNFVTVVRCKVGCSCFFMLWVDFRGQFLHLFSLNVPVFPQFLSRSSLRSGKRCKEHKNIYYMEDFSCFLAMTQCFRTAAERLSNYYSFSF